MAWEEQWLIYPPHVVGGEAGEEQEEESSYPSPRGSGPRITSRDVGGNHKETGIPCWTRSGFGLPSVSVEQEESKLGRWQGNKSVLPQTAACIPTTWSWL